MPKRRLTRRQAWRIQKVQEERLKRTEKKATGLQERLTSDQLGPEQEGLIVAHFGAVLEVEDAAGHLHRCVTRQNLGTLVCGDRVVWQPGRDGAGAIVALFPRRSLLARPDPSGQVKPIAANIDQILVVAAPIPALNEGLIDRYLVAAEHTGIEPAILVNKADLLDASARTHIEQRLALYREIGYAVLFASTKAATGLDALHQRLLNRTSVFVGQSGVGKSSLVNRLLPAADARTGPISEATGKGMHTTSTARLYHLPEGGEVIDSPGVREFGLADISRQEVALGFREFRPFLAACKFRDCTHSHEPGCALRAAVTTGELSQARLDSYHRIVESLQA